MPGLRKAEWERASLIFNRGSCGSAAVDRAIARSIPGSTILCDTTVPSSLSSSVLGGTPVNGRAEKVKEIRGYGVQSEKIEYGKRRERRRVKCVRSLIVS